MKFGGRLIIFAPSNLIFLSDLPTLKISYAQLKKFKFCRASFRENSPFWNLQFLLDLIYFSYLSIVTYNLALTVQNFKVFAAAV